MAALESLDLDMDLDSFDSIDQQVSGNGHSGVRRGKSEAQEEGGARRVRHRKSR